MSDSVHPKGDVAAVAANTDVVVDSWWQDHFPGSVVGRDTEIWNYISVAKERLKVLLRGTAGGV